VARRKRSSLEAQAWLEAKLATMRERMAAPMPELPPPPRKRYQLSKDVARKAPAPSFECPLGIPAAEWAIAVRNVKFGSTASSIKKDSDVPSDFSLRIMGLAP
jgi:hypothetical protein